MSVISMNVCQCTLRLQEVGGGDVTAVDGVESLFTVCIRELVELAEEPFEHAA